MNNYLIIKNFIDIYCDLGACIKLKIKEDTQIIKLNHIGSHYDGQEVVIEGDNDYRYIIRDIDKKIVVELDDYLLIHNKDVDIYIEDFI